MYARPTTPAALSWLSRIFAARFGCPLRLTVQRGTWVLNHPNHAGRILFPVLAVLHNSDASALPCIQLAVPGVPQDRVLTAPGLARVPAALCDRQGGNLAVHYDVPGLVFWALTRLEELHPAAPRDRHGRFPASASHAARHDYLERPVVDEWMVALHGMARDIWPGLPPLRTAPVPLRLSHDVDTPLRHGFVSLPVLLRRMAGDARRGQWGDVLRAPWHWLTWRRGIPARDPANSFDWLMDLSDAHGLTNAFYFITEPDWRGADPRYTFDHPVVRALLRHIHARGHEIGLHPSMDSFSRPDRIAAEARTLRRVCREEGITQDRWGGRMHYLQWRAWDTSAQWAAAGLSYDTTLGYADRPGFRAGTCFDYPGFDPVADRTLGIAIRPLVVMEQTIISTAYLALAPEAARARIGRLADRCRAVGGCFTLLWHNDVLATQANRDLYQYAVTHVMGTRNRTGAIEAK